MDGLDTYQTHICHMLFLGQAIGHVNGQLPAQGTCDNLKATSPHQQKKISFKSIFLVFKNCPVFFSGHVLSGLLPVPGSSCLEGQLLRSVRQGLADCCGREDAPQERSNVYHSQGTSAAECALREVPFAVEDD